MRPPIEYLFPPELGTELVYSFVIILCSLMIYFSTKEMYKLTSYKGIKYFRLAFLFFAIAFFLQYFSIFLMKFLDLIPFFSFSPKEALTAILILFIYSSALGTLYLIHSVTWKKWDSKYAVVIFNLIAILIAILSEMFLGIFSVFIINIIFFLFQLFLVQFFQQVHNCLIASFLPLFEIS